MGTDKLLNMLNKKVEELQLQKEQGERKIVEIKQIQNIIRTIQNNPFDLYELDNEAIDYIFSALSLGDEYLEKVINYKVVYEGYKKFGRAAVPQISLVEEFIDLVKTRLDERKYNLSDEVAEHQYVNVLFKEYNDLRQELQNPEKVVTRIKILSKFLRESSLSLKEQIDIKLEINSRNNSLYESQNLSVEPINDNYDENNVTEIAKIEQSLSERFNPATLNNMKSIAELLSYCKTREEIESIIGEWKFSFSNDSIISIVDGLISLKQIEMLTLEELIADEDDDYKEDVSAIDLQLKLLQEYKESSLAVSELEEDSLVGDITEDISSGDKFQEALDNYSSDPLTYPTCVLFLSDSIERDIKDISDQETIDDIFLLIEKLKKNEIIQKTKLVNNKRLRDVEQIKPNSKGRQARVLTVRLSDNIYGILQLSSKKSVSPREDTETIETRRRMCNIDKLREEINTPELLSYYVEKTKIISDKLMSKVSGNKVSSDYKGGSK